MFIRYILPEFDMQLMDYIQENNLIYNPNDSPIQISNKYNIQTNDNNLFNLIFKKKFRHETYLYNFQDLTDMNNEILSSYIHMKKSLNFKIQVSSNIGGFTNLFSLNAHMIQMLDILRDIKSDKPYDVEEIKTKIVQFESLSTNYDLKKIKLIKYLIYNELDILDVFTYNDFIEYKYTSSLFEFACYFKIQNDTLQKFYMKEGLK